MNKSKKFKKVLSVVLAACMVGTLAAGCGSEESSGEGSGEIVVKLPTYKAGENTGAKLFLPQVERFNEKYEGTYRIEIEQVPQESYNDKIKQLAQQDMLPTLIEGGDKNWIQEYVIPNKLYYDLGPWLEEHQELKEILIDESLDFSTVDGEVVGMPLAITKPVGLFYNTSMYQPSGVIKDMTWEEFAEDLGDNTIAFATGGPAFMSQLVYTAMIATQPGGEELLKSGLEEKIIDYNDPIFINAAEQLQDLVMSNGADNSTSAAGPDAMNYFLSAKAAVIPNGPWFAAEFDPEKADKWSNGFNGEDAAADIYPGNVVVSNLRETTWWIADSASDEQKEAALAFLEFIYSPEELETALLEEGGTAPDLETSEEYNEKAKENKVYVQLNAAIDEETIYAPQIDNIMPSSLSTAEFGKILIKLFDGSMTPEEFCQALTEKAQLSQQ